jgi:hypothetical protein
MGWIAALAELEGRMNRENHVNRRQRGSVATDRRYACGAMDA